MILTLIFFYESMSFIDLVANGFATLMFAFLYISHNAGWKRYDISVSDNKLNIIDRLIDDDRQFVMCIGRIESYWSREVIYLMEAGGMEDFYVPQVQKFSKKIVVNRLLMAKVNSDELG